jgi:succinate-semialdehyde dehydrogenase / glutarate-semialdehyde dehydrogenase
VADFSLDQIADLPLDLFAGGHPLAASDGGRFDVEDPATGRVITTVADGTVEDAIAAVDAATAAWAACDLVSGGPLVTPRRRTRTGGDRARSGCA